MPKLAIFTAPKPFTNPHIATIQRNAIGSWLALGSDVEVLVIGEEPGLAEAVAELGARRLPDVARNASGTPLISSIFELARNASGTPILAYVNADILLMPDFLAAADCIAAQASRFLAVGQRWDLDVPELLDLGPGWDRGLVERVAAQGRLHPPAGSDYFIFPRACFTDVPAFAVGRAGWDNWMIYHARCQGWPVVDVTPAARVIHQDHDYSHLPGGQPHYRLPETGENVRLAGGRRTIFTLYDASHRLVDGRLRPLPTTWPRFWRAAEIFPLVKLHSLLLAQLSYGLFHPRKAYRDARKYLRKSSSTNEHE